MNEDEDEETQIRSYQINQQHRLSKMVKEEVKEVEEKVQCVEFDIVNENSSVENENYGEAVEYETVHETEENENNEKAEENENVEEAKEIENLTHWYGGTEPLHSLRCCSVDSLR